MMGLAQQRARLLLVTLWAGSLWTVGYLVAPTLFATLADRVLAGTIAGFLFRSEAWLSLACGALLLALFAGAHELEPARRRALLVVVGAMLVCTLASHYGLQPLMEALKQSAGPGGVMAPAAHARFGLLHGASALLYLAQSLLAGYLVFRHR